MSENVVHAEMESICDDCVCDVQPLLKVTSDGHEVCALEEMELGADVNERDSYQYTALINAASQGLNKCAKELINVGADVNAQDHGSYTALMFAAITSNLECVNMLINAGANLDHTTNDDMTALMFAGKQGYYQCIDALIEAGADVNVIDCYGHTAVTVETDGVGSLEERHYRCIESLIAAGADVNIPNYNDDNSGYIALSDAAFDGDARRIGLYLKAGVHINDKQKYGYSALGELIEEKEGVDEEVAFLLFTAGDKINKTLENIPEYLRPTMCLKDMCRRAIRKHLIELYPKNHLFERIPQLKLPHLLTRYLLYNMSLETSKNQVDVTKFAGADHENGKGKPKRENDVT